MPILDLGEGTARMAYVLSFDFGTGGVRAGVYSTDRRSILSMADVPYATTYPHIGWAEQNPADWLAAMHIAGRDAVARAGITAIDAICVASTASTVAVALRDGAPIRPAILWMDCRAEAEARKTETVTHPVMAYAGGGDAVEWLVPKAMWLARHQPAIWAQAEVVCEALDYINHHLTGEWVASRMNAACKWNYDSLTGAFVPEIYAELGISDLADKLPGRVVPVGGVIAPLRADMAAAFGLSTLPIVAQGGIDAHIGMLAANTVASGGMLMIGGTSVVHLTQLDGPGDMRGFWGPYPNALADGLWLVECGQVSAGSILNWLSGTIFGLDQAGHSALIAEAMARPGRAEGLLTLDYWMGNRTPYRDGALRGALMGLTLGHGRADIYASVVDSIALGTLNVLGVLAERGVPIDRVVLAGGICKNALWLQSTIDAIGRPVEVAPEDNLSLVGAGVAAAAALGLYSDLQAAAIACAAPTQLRHPNPDRTAWYHAALPLYRQATDALTPVLHDLAARQKAGTA